MKHKLKTLVAAIVLAAGVVPAQAAITIGTGSGANAEMWLAAWSPSLQRSYIRDLGVRVGNFVPTSTTAPTSGSYAFNPTAIVPTTTGASPVASGYNLTFQNDALLTSASGLGNGTGGLVADVVWMIGAADTTGTGTGGTRYLSTINSPTASALASTLPNGRLANFATANTYIGANNLLGTNVGTTTNGSAVATPGSAAYFAAAPINLWGTYANFNAAGAVGQSLEFFYLTPGAGDQFQFASSTRYQTATGAAFAWTLNTDGSLSYAAVPIPAAAWLFGSGLIGLVGIARRRKTLVA